MSDTLSLPDYEFKADPATGWTIAKFSLTEKLNHPYECVLELVNPAGDTADPKKLLGVSCSISITRHSTTGGTTSVERDVKGIIRRVENLGVVVNYPNYAYVRVYVVPALQALSLNLNSRIFPDKTANAILANVLGAGLKAYNNRAMSDGTTGTYVDREYTVQYRESDLDFVHRLLAYEGIGYYFDHTGSVEKMCLFDSNSACPVATTAAGKGQIDVALVSDQTETLADFCWESALVPNAVEVKDFDWTQPTANIDVSASTGPKPDGVTRQIYDSTPGLPYDKATPGVPATQKTSTYHMLGKPGNTVTPASLRVSAVGLPGLIYEGAGNAIGLQPGAVLQVQGTTNGEDDGKYLITGVEHQGLGQVAAQFGDTFTAGPLYSNTFTAIPYATAYRPARQKTEIRQVPGPQTAKVVGPSGQEVFSDQYGRVKIQFPWDTGPVSDNSVFVRCQQVWAGNNFGAMFLPRIGMEVVVQFLDGNPDRPIVTGCVYNGSNAPPWSTSSDGTKSGLVTQSSPGGAGNNELVFEDQAGSEKITLNASKDLDVSVKNKETLKVMSDRTKEVHGTQTESITGHDNTTVMGIRTQQVLGADLLTVGGARAVTVGGAYATTVVGAMNIAVGGLLAEEVAGARIEAVLGVKSSTITGALTSTVLGPEARSSIALTETVAGPIARTGAAISDVATVAYSCAAGTVSMNAGSGPASIVATGPVALTGSSIMGLATGAIQLTVAPNILSIDTTGITLAVGANTVLINSAGITITSGANTISLSSAGITVNSGGTMSLTAMGAMIVKGTPTTAIN